MEEKRYIISDASKMLKVESHVLRYWEEELEIDIPRNEMGHRYYTENHIQLLNKIRDLKDQGYGLRMIKMMISDPKEVKRFPEENGIAVSNKKMDQFQKIMGNIITKALEENTERIVIKAMEKSTKEMKQQLTDGISEKMLKEMDYIMRAREEKEEERYKKIDELIRDKQKGKSKYEAKLKKAENKLELQAQKNRKKAEKEMRKSEKKKANSKKWSFITVDK